MRRLRAVGWAGGMVVAVAAIVGWSARFRIATHIVDRRLAAAHVPATYRLTRIGPWLERMEDVRIGDPAAPDLTARRIDVSLGYGWTGPVVRGVSVDGARLRASLDRNGLNLGAIDRLVPKSGGETRLPDLDLALRDIGLILATPGGTLTAALAGDGNPARSFAGHVEAKAATLRLASCMLGNTDAALQLLVTDGKPRLIGPVHIGTTRCPSLTLGAGAATVDAASNTTFDRVRLRATLDGFGGAAGPARFDQVTGPVNAEGTLGDLKAKASLILTGLAVPAAAQRAARLQDAAIGTPLGPTTQRAARALAALLTRSEAQADLEATIAAQRVSVALLRASLAGADGGRVRLAERGGLRWSPTGWRIDGDLAMGGGALPSLHASLRQPAPGQIAVTATVDPYRVGAAMLALDAGRLGWDGRALRFDGVMRADGPVGDGLIAGLTVPLGGSVAAHGGVALDGGCRPVSFKALRLASFVWDPARLSVCGPVTTGATTRIDLSTTAVRLGGHSGSGAPVLVTAARVGVTGQGFSAGEVTADLGEGDARTHLALATLNGRLGKTIAGQFTGATGGIAHVPLALDAGEGQWALAGGVLALGGTLRVSDVGAAPRFNPLVADDLALRLDGSAITARASLLEPTTRAPVANVMLAHDLGLGRGHADLAVPGLAFALKRLQPEKLTPLTLGVIANVAGTVRGEGRIDWSPDGVSSHGRFVTDRLDLAAAFGPVSGISGQVVFTDLLGLVTAPHQEARIAEVNPGVAVADGILHYQLVGGPRLQIEDAHWPFAGGTLRLEPSLIDLGADRARRLTFRIEKLDAAAFVQQLQFPNISATGIFDGSLPMVFDAQGGRIEKGEIVARSGGGTLAYVGELSNAQLGTMGKLAFDALKAIRYSALDIALDGRLDGEMVSRVRFTGVREATPEQSLVTRLIRNLPFRFNITIHAPFRGLVGSARAYMDPRLLLNQANALAPGSTPAGPPAIQPSESAPVR